MAAEHDSGHSTSRATTDRHCLARMQWDPASGTPRVKMGPQEISRRLIQRADARREVLSATVDLYVAERFLYRLEDPTCAGKFLVRGDFALVGHEDETIEGEWTLQLLWTGALHESALLATLRRAVRLQRAGGVVFRDGQIKAWHREYSVRGTCLWVRLPALVAEFESTLTIEIETWTPVSPMDNGRLMPTIDGVPGARIHCLSLGSALAQCIHELAARNASPRWGKACLQLVRLFRPLFRNKGTSTWQRRLRRHSPLGARLCQIDSPCKKQALEKRVRTERSGTQFSTERHERPKNPWRQRCRLSGRDLPPCWIVRGK